MNQKSQSNSPENRQRLSNQHRISNSQMKDSSQKKKSEYLQKTFGIDTDIKKSITKQKFTVILLGPSLPRLDYNVSSMYDKFEKPDYTVAELLQYYFSKFKDNGPHQYLTNKLYSVNYEDLEFYIPQLCYLLIKNDSPYLERFLASLCSQSVALYELINWCFVSYSDKDRMDKVRHERLTRIDSVLENAMATTNNSDSVIQHKLKSYQSAVQLYLNNLIQMSLILKTFKAEDRKPNLKNFISRANVALERFKSKTVEYQFCQGISLPFTSSRIYGKIIHSNMVVRLIEGECTCFNTKKRVPYRIVVETIDPQELSLKQPIKKSGLSSVPSQMSLKSQGNLDEDAQMEDFLHNDLTLPDKEELERKMIEIVKNKKNQNYGDLRKIKIEENDEKRGISLLKNIISTIQVVKRQQTNNQEELKDLELTLQNEIDKKEQVMKIVDKRRSFKNAVDKDKYEINLKRFKILFTERNIERTNSCIPKLNDTYYQEKQKKDIRFWLSRFKLNTQNNHKYNHKVAKQLTTYQRIKFFQDLMKNYPLFEQSIHKMYLCLQLDLYEKKYEKSKIHNKGQDIEIPRKFGPWDELWEDKAEAIKRNSPYQNFDSYQLKPIIVKGGDDLRQELMTMQIIRKIKQAFEDNGLSLYVKAYEIIVVSNSSGLLEFCADTISIDGLKKKYPACKSLVHIYKEVFQAEYEEAQRYFVQSLAAYSIISYLLQIKDRHNGNILIDSLGRVIHIDFGFILCTSPGNINFEKAPFKLTMEYVDLMDGVNSDLFFYFKNLIFQGFRALEGVVGEIINIIEIMMQDSDFPCFEKFDIKQFRDRFYENSTDLQLTKYIDRLINDSNNSWRTTQYDSFQRMTNGIMP